MHSRLMPAAAVLAIATSLAVAAADPVSADASGFGFTDKEGVGAGASQAGGSTGATIRRARPSSPVRCDYGRLSDEDASLIGEGTTVGWWNERGSGPGAWFRKICFDARGMSAATVVWIADRPDPRRLAEQALDRVPVPGPAMRLNPAADQTQVVNVETWLAIEPSQWKPVSATASAGGVTVTTTASPERVVWRMGNGDQVVCAGPGATYDPSKPAAGQDTDCAYTYRRSSAAAQNGRYQVSATVEWSVRWSADGIAGAGELAPLSRTASVAVRVAEIQALNR